MARPVSPLSRRWSRARLVRLREQFERQKRGISESALAEVEIASLMVRGGYSIAFLPESNMRTADLECCLGIDRLFVEITVVAPTSSSQRIGLFPRSRETMEGPLENDVRLGVLMRRLMARMAEKARQLSRYCAPVVLAVTVPDQILWMDPKQREGELDLKRLAGVLVTSLVQVPQLSAVLLTLWNVRSRQSQSNIRLANVHCVERSLLGKGLSPIRLLAVNSFATYSLGGKEIQALQKAM